MKSKKWTVIISFAFMITSGILFTILHFQMYTQEMKNVIKYIIPVTIDVKSYIKDISLGIFTGTIFSFIIGISDYTIERRIALERYYLVSFSILNNFRHLEVLYIREPIELVKGYYFEKEHNEIVKLNQDELVRVKNGIESKSNFDKNGSLQDFYQERDEAKKMLLKWLSENSKTKEQKYLNEEDRLNEIILEYNETIDKIVNQYSALGELDYIEADTAYCGIDFILINKIYRNKYIYNQIHQRQLELINEMKKTAYKLKNSENSRAIQIETIMKIQSKIIEISEDEIAIHFYNKYYGEMIGELLGLAELAYGSKLKEEAKRLSRSTVKTSIMKVGI